MSINYTSSGTKNRYVGNKESEKKNTQKSTPKESKQVVKPVGPLTGRNKRNMWLDYPEEPFVREHNPLGLAEMTTFKIKFPQHRELYIKTNEDGISSVLNKHFIHFTPNYKNGELIISTTNETFDPFIIVKSKLMMNCISRGVPLEKAKDLLKDNIFCDVIHIKQLCRNEKVFKKRRKRLFGPNGSTLKAIEILTNTFVIIMGGTVTAIGSVDSCREVRRLVEDCMFNKHPIYRIKELMITNKYKKDPEMKGKDWGKFLPQFKKTSVKRKKKKKIVRRKRSFVIPGPQMSKVDLQLESGEYFMKEAERVKKRKEKQRENRMRNRKEKKEKRGMGNRGVIRRREEGSSENGRSLDERIERLKGKGKKRKRSKRSVDFYIDKRPPSKKVKRE